jgi:hypothetical protein
MLFSDSLHAAADSDTDTYRQTVDGAWGHLRKNRKKDWGPEEDRNSTEGPTESTNLDSLGSQSEWPTKHSRARPRPLCLYVVHVHLGLYIDPEQLEWGLPKSCGLYVGYVLLAKLPCLISMGEEVPSLAETWSARVGRGAGAPTCPEGKGEVDRGMNVEGVTRRRGVRCM